MSDRSVRVVICFHDKDVDALEILETHLAPLCRGGAAELWHKRKTVPGDPQLQVFDDKLRAANIIVLLVSADFNADWDARISAAIRACPPPVTRVLPVILRPCTWTDLPFFGLQPIPADGDTLIKDGRVLEERFHEAALAIRKAVEQVGQVVGADEPPTAAPRTITETLAQLERERYQFEQLARDALAAPTYPAEPKPKRQPQTIDELFAELSFGEDIPSRSSVAPAANPGSTTKGSTSQVISDFPEVLPDQPTEVCRENPPSDRRQAILNLRRAVMIATDDNDHSLPDDELFSLAATLIESAYVSNAGACKSQYPRAKATNASDPGGTTLPTPQLEPQEKLDSDEEAVTATALKQPQEELVDAPQSVATSVDSSHPVNGLHNPGVTHADAASRTEQPERPSSSTLSPAAESPDDDAFLFAEQLRQTRIKSATRTLLLLMLALVATGLIGYLWRHSRTSPPYFVQRCETCPNEKTAQPGVGSDKPHAAQSVLRPLCLLSGLAAQL